ncbi:TfoX/Sxy family protein [Micromonospora sp. CPCC 205371]|nr:TfoX/Sxy family protein [Micromonospora sp. CPCC 205371]
MAYDEQLADKVRDLLDGRPGITEVRMFGGLAWLANGNMAVAVRGKGGLLVRTDPADTEAMLDEPGTDTMIMRGREMRGWITVAPQACAAPEDVARWVERGLAYALTLPPK